MIISHQYKYCFFAIPRTGSQALSKHLIENYGGERLGKMHCSYDEFHKETKHLYSGYYSFTIIRNPLDSLVSAYFKKRNDHNGRFSRGTFRNGQRIGKKSMAEYHFIKEKNASFSEYFTHFFKKPIRWPRHTQTMQSVDQIIRFESLDEGFELVCNQVAMPFEGIPVINKTRARSADWSKYYDQEARDLAKITLAPLMASWGYAFPKDW